MDTGSPSIDTVPVSATRILLMMRSRVVLPAPLGPSSPQMQPRGMESDTLSRARFVGLASPAETKFLVSPSAHIAGVLSLSSVI